MLKNAVRSLMATVMVISFVACGVSTHVIAAMGRSERTEVFTEVPAGETVPAGFADVVIRASLKTPLEGYYPLESKESVDGKPEYAFLINIDGQAVLWKVKGRRHDLPKYREGEVSRDPEAGEGMRYELEKNIRLAAGAHNVFFGLPGEPYFTTAEIAVKNGESYILEFKPHYRYKTMPTRIPAFLKGLNNYEVVFTTQGH